MSISASIKLDEYVPDNSRHTAPAVASSSAPLTSAPPGGRKIDRACDFCRRRKTRCDGGLTRHSKCTNCRRNNALCTYVESSRPRGPSKAYVTALEDRVERFEKLLKRLRPDTDFDDVLGPSVERGSWKNDYDSSQPSSKSQPAPDNKSASPQPPASSSSQPRGSVSSTAWTESSESSLSDDEDLGIGAPLPSSPSTRQMRLEAGTFSQDAFWKVGERPDGSDDTCTMRFCGKSSLYSLIHDIRKLKTESRGNHSQEEHSPVTHFGGVPYLRPDIRRSAVCSIPKTRRELFWNLSPWEIAWERRRTQQPCPSASLATVTPPIFQFPPLDLVSPLITLYFKHTNVFYPLLHYPTLSKSFNDGLHLRDAQFAAVIWCIMAIGARWSEDQRVLWDGWPGPNGNEARQPGGMDWASAGWRFYLRGLDAPSFAVTTLRPPTLYDVQSCALASIFLRGSSVHPAGWTLVSVGLRKAMDVGAHRKKVYGTKPSVENELWKRAFWVLVLFDRIGSAAIGRPCCTHEEDFDLDYPLEVDDEYWIAGTPVSRGFAQPPGKPSLVSGFITLLKLSRIYAHASRTIYSTDKSRSVLGLVGNDWQTSIVSRLNAELDEWLDSVPQHLRWRKGITSPAFLNQSSTLYTGYYLLLIFIYRPFVNHPVMLSQRDAPSSKDVASFPFPAFAICTNAARAGLSIVEETLHQCPGLPWNVPYFIQVMVNSVGVLEMQQWAIARGRTKENDGGHNSGEWVGEDIVAGLQSCERLLELVQDRWVMARNVLRKIREPMEMSPHADSASSNLSQSDSPDNYGPSPFAYYNEVRDMETDSDVWQSLGNYENQSPSSDQTAQTGGGTGGQPYFRMHPVRLDQSHDQPYHHTPFYLREAHANYGPTLTVPRRPSDPGLIVHRESALRCANSPSPPYQSQGFHNGAPYGIQTDAMNSAVYSQGVNSIAFDARFDVPSVSGAIGRGGTVPVPMDSPPIPGAHHHRPDNSGWVANYSIGGV